MKRSVVCRWSSVVRRWSSVVMLLVAVTVGSAQEYGDLHGTWINANFIEVLKRTASVAEAMEAVSATAPLWVKIDSANKDGDVEVGFDFSVRKPMMLLKAQLIGPELRWGLGDAVGPIWLVTADQEQGTFIALHVLDSMGKEPKVLGKLPSRNQDPKFIIDRMLNASILAGKYRDSSGKLVEFTTYMDAFWGDVRYRVAVDVQEVSHQLTVVLTADDGRSKSFIVSRRVKDLILTSPDGTVQTLRFAVKY